MGQNPGFQTVSEMHTVGKKSLILGQNPSFPKEYNGWKHCTLVENPSKSVSLGSHKL